MADQVKVFKSGELAASDLTNSNEYVLVQTNSTTKAVVKDIVVDATVAPTLSDSSAAGVALYSDSVNLGGYATLTGSEIIDVNSKLYYKLTPTPTLGAGNFSYTTDGTTLNFIASTTVVGALTTTPSFNNSATSNYTFKSNKELITSKFDSSFTDFATTGTTAGSVSSMTQPWFYYSGPGRTYAWYFKYDGNSSTWLYYATCNADGVATSGWSTRYTNAYSNAAIDLKGKTISSYNGSTLRTWDTDTAGEIINKSVNSVFGGVSSYSCSAACNQMFFCYTQIGADGIRYTTTNTASTTAAKLSFPSGGTPNYDSHMTFGACYNPSEDKYYFLMGGNNTNMKVYTMAGATVSAISAGTLTYLGLATTVFGFPVEGSQITGDHFGNMFAYSEGKRYILSFANNTATRTEQTTTGGIYQTAANKYSGWLLDLPTFTNTSAASLEDIQASVKCKVSGVEITGV